MDFIVNHLNRSQEIKSKTQDMLLSQQSNVKYLTIFLTRVFSGKLLISLFNVATLGVIECVWTDCSPHFSVCDSDGNENNCIRHMFEKEAISF